MVTSSRQNLRQNASPCTVVRPSERAVEVRLDADPVVLARAAAVAVGRHVPVDAAIGVALDIVEAGIADELASRLRAARRPQRWSAPEGYARWLDVLGGRCGWWEDSLPTVLVPGRLRDVASDRDAAATALGLLQVPAAFDSVLRAERWAVLSGGFSAGELLSAATLASRGSRQRGYARRVTGTTPPRA
jgi:hypothetical protein